MPGHDIPLSRAGAITGGRWRVCFGFATVLGLTGLVGLGVRLFPFASQPWQAVAAFAVYPMLAAPVSAALYLACRAWAPATMALLLVAASVVTQAPQFVGQASPEGGIRLVVMTSNLRLGHADPSAITRQVAKHDVDVLMLEELTEAGAERLAATGLESMLPHRRLAPGTGAIGVGIWSRYPIQDGERPDGFSFNIVAAKLAVPNTPTTVLVTHLPGPWPDPSEWGHDIDRLGSVLRGLASARPTMPILAGGDFNATRDNAQFRRLLTDGYRDAAEQAGAGIGATYPADAWYPPLIAIDHVLTRNAVATSARTLSVEGSDHRALLTEVVLQQPSALPTHK